MRGPRFNGTNTKIETVDECVKELSRTWTRYTSARIRYAEALLHHNRTHHGFDVAAMEESTKTVDETRTQYFNSIEILKEAHRAYKTAFRDLLIGKLL